MVKNPSANVGDMRCRFDPWVRKIPWREDMTTYSSILAWRIPGRGSLVGCCIWGRTESDMTEAT